MCVTLLGLRVQKIIQKTLQRNAYFAHPEAILLSMLEDRNQDVRAQAVNTILTICMKANNSSQVLGNEALAPDDRGVDEIDDDCSLDTPWVKELGLKEIAKELEDDFNAKDWMRSANFEDIAEYNECRIMSIRNKAVVCLLVRNFRVYFLKLVI
mgnify:CR=1 FL=1